MQTTSELGRQPNLANSLSKRVFARVVTTAAVMMLALASQWIQACEILDPNQLQASYDLGASTPGVVWIHGTITLLGGSPINNYFSGFVIGVRKDLSGNVLNTYIAVPMHGFAYPGESVTGAGTGNYFSRNGVNFTNLTSVYQSRLWNPFSPNSTAGDIAIFSSPTGVPDSWIHSLAPVGSLQAETVVTSVGYGFPSTPNGTLTTTGNPMGFNSEISMTVANGMQYGTYFSGGMHPWIQMSGAGNSGDSGSLAINAAGQIIGMLVGGTISAPTDLDRTTYFSNFTAPEFYNQVAPYSGIIIVPPPTLLMQRSGTNVVVTWSGTFTLQTATNLTTGFTDVPGAASPYTNSVTAGPQRFFRLRLP
jgi:hypothetical protein